MEASVLGLVNHAHAATAQFFKDAVGGDGFADEGQRACHLVDTFGCSRRQFNEERR
jgi:hypothetical protein